MLPIILATASTLYLLVGLVVFGRKEAGYSHLKHTISELGEIGSTQQRVVAYGVFLPVGLLTLATAALSAKAMPSVAGLALALSTGYVVAAFFPCDRGSPLSGSARQAVHNAGGAVQYIGGATALFAAAEPIGQPFKAAGFAVLAATVAISLLPSVSVRGAVQRTAELILFSSLIVGTITIARSAA